eukprot:1144507-Pelagomonas_calceolata.AAC.2
MAGCYPLDIHVAAGPALLHSCIGPATDSRCSVGGHDRWRALLRLDALEVGILHAEHAFKHLLHLHTTDKCWEFPMRVSGRKSGTSPQMLHMGSKGPGRQLKWDTNKQQG